MGLSLGNTAAIAAAANPSAHVLLAEDSDGEAVGGLRVHVYDGRSKVPLMEALRSPKNLRAVPPQLPARARGHPAVIIHTSGPGAGQPACPSP